MDHRNTNQHPDKLLLPYLENILSLDEKLMVEEHLQSCPECSQAAERLRLTIELLARTREAFCPELWELYAFVHYHQDDRGSIAAHVNECPSCRETCDQWRHGVLSNDMPQELHQRLKERLQGKLIRPPESQGLLTGLSERLSRLLRVPSIAGAAVAVAALVLIWFWPHEIPQEIMAPSTVTWEGVSRPKAFQSDRKRIAIIICLKGFPSSLSQREMDSLYRAVAPDMTMLEQFDFVTPAAITDAVQRLAPPPRDTGDVLTILRGQLGVSQAIVMTVQPAAEGFKIDSRMIDLASNQTMGSQIGNVHKKSDLEPKIRSIVQSFLSSTPTEREDESHR